uniref:TIMELESS-interacting protein n=1 Tax=Sinocyclocheilus rhinocerous TaxID=307959 RepID=A0A673KL76_9TELE
MLDPLENGLFDDETHIVLCLGEEEGEVSKLAEVPVAKRRTVKRPQPKLDANRLISEKGLPALRALFDGVKFKENLKLLLQKMDNWAHRLYPKMQFEEFIDKVETCLKRIRLDMPITHEDYVEEGEGRVLEESDPVGDEGFPEDPFVHSTPAPASLTEEQQRHIELNKRLALERRLAKQKQLGVWSHLIQENQATFEQSTSAQTPLKQKSAALQNSPLYDNECASLFPNGIVDDDDSN